MTRRADDHHRVHHAGATIAIAISDPRRARDMARALTRVLSQASRDASLRGSHSAPRVVHVRTRRRLAQLGTAGLTGALAIVRVTAASAPRLPQVVEGVRAAGALGVQIVWDGLAPPRAAVERWVFSALERARASPGGPPVVLTRTADPSATLRALIAHRQRKDDGS